MIFAIHLSLIFHCFRFLKPFHLNARYWISDRCLLRFYFLIGMMNLSLYMFSLHVGISCQAEGFSGFFWRRFLFKHWGDSFRLCISVLWLPALLSTGSALLFFFRQKIILYIKNIQTSGRSSFLWIFNVRSKSPLAEIYPWNDPQNEWYLWPSCWWLWIEDQPFCKRDLLLYLS